MSGDVDIVLLVFVGGIVAFAALRYQQHRLERRLHELRTESPIDGPTGLLSRRSFEQRVESEARRVDRFGGRLHVWVARVDGDASIGDAVGARLHQALEFPRLGFRFGDTMLCVVVPEPESMPIDVAALYGDVGSCAGSSVRAHGWSVYESRRGSIRDTLATAMMPIVEHEHRGVA